MKYTRNNKVEHTKKIFTHYFRLAGFDSEDNVAEIEGAVESLFEAAVEEARQQIHAEKYGRPETGPR